MLALAAIAFLVGVLIGCVGIGGILLIPAISVFTGMETRLAMGTALLSFLFTALYGTFLFYRRGTIDWAVSIPICLGAAIFGYVGAQVNAIADPLWLNMLLSLIIVFAGAYVLMPSGSAEGFVFNRRSHLHLALMAGIGAGVGFISGLTGVGGPVLSVPVMIALGFSPLVAVATGQVIQVAAASSGTLGNVANGSIHFPTAAWLTVVQLFGLALGVHTAHRLKTAHLRRMVALVCLAVGGFLFTRNVAALM
jgi:uncharacterized membrane protein YfcA